MSPELVISHCVKKCPQIRKLSKSKQTRKHTSYLAWLPLAREPLSVCNSLLLFLPLLPSKTRARGFGNTKSVYVISLSHSQAERNPTRNFRGLQQCPEMFPMVVTGWRWSGPPSLWWEAGPAPHPPMCGTAPRTIIQAKMSLEWTWRHQG